MIVLAAVAATQASIWLAGGIDSVGSFRGADAQRLNAPGAGAFGITDRIMSASPSFSSPLISAVTCVYAWSVIPRETFTGSMVLSACSFQTTAFSARGARGRF